MTGLLASAITTGLKGAQNFLTSPISNSVTNAYSNSTSQGSSWGQEGSNQSSMNATLGYEASLRSAAAAEEANRLNKWFFEEQQKFNREEAQKNRDYQERMANSQYQRAVADLRKAGLNPILAAAQLGSASVPTGSVATSGLQSAQMAQSIADSYGYGSGSSYGTSGSSNNSNSQSQERSTSESKPMIAQMMLADALSKNSSALNAAAQGLMNNQYVKNKYDWINFKK